MPLVIGVASVPVTMRGPGIARFGLLSLAITVLEYSALFALGLGPATTRYVAQAIARNDENKSDLWREDRGSGGIPRTRSWLAAA